MMLPPNKTPPLRLAAAVLALTGLTCLLAGCASPGPQARRPLAQPLSAQQLGLADPSPNSPQTAAELPWPGEQAWLAFAAPGEAAQLSALIARALDSQPTLALAAARLDQAEAALGIPRAAQGPQAQLSVDLTDQRFTENGLVPKPVAGSIRWNNSATLGFSWELDLFGRQQAALAAAIGQARAAAAEAQAARLLLSSQISAAWVQLARQLAQQRLVEATLLRRQQLQQLVRQRREAGLDTEIELRQADGSIAQARAELAQLDEAVQRSRHALAELSGQAPQALATLAPALPPAQAPSQALPQQLPADLLGRRADLVAQRWRVEAALREVDVARAQFYPNLNLTAFVGLSSLGLQNFVEAGALTYGVGPALRLPVFDGGRLRAQLGGRQAEVQAAVAGYDGTLLRALREVADEIASLQALARQQQAQQQASQAAQAQQALARQRAEAGLGSRAPLLQAELGLLAQQRNELELQGRVLQAQVALAKALGGGWQAGPEGLPAAMAQAAQR
ncbi:MAG: efflux transporter outer membrane subunit [Burkholderiaceae bacterium]|nr:efflux transporter outer membrane subunit [Burkholderiaceae bacterium]